MENFFKISIEIQDKIDFFNFFFACRKKLVTDEDPFGLTAALDQMAFAQDIVMMDTQVQKGTETTATTATTVKPKKASDMAPPDYETVTEQIVTQQQVPSTISQKSPTPPSVSASKAPTTTTTPAKSLIPEKVFNDPLRDLILLSEVILIDDEKQFMRNVKSLAEDSSCLDYVLEVKSTDSYNQLQQRKQDLVKSSQLEQGIALFQNPKEIVDPVKEAEFLKTLAELEDTDDSEVEKPVLGKISLVRRAKSAAATRTSSDKGKCDENPIFHVAWEDIEVSCGGRKGDVKSVKLKQFEFGK